MGRAATRCGRSGHGGRRCLCLAAWIGVAALAYPATYPWLTLSTVHPRIVFCVTVTVTEAPPSAR